VCRQLGRRFVLIDSNPVAVEVMRDRLQEGGGPAAAQNAVLAGQG
jgi:DNA modification methylase